MVTLFFNCGNTKECQVYSLWEEFPGKNDLVKKVLGKRYLLVDRWKKCYSEFAYKKKKDKRDINRLLLFGYRDAQYPVIRCIESGKYIGPDWFDNNSEDSLCIVFTPKGAGMLEQGSWPGSIKNWVSFKDRVDFLCGSEVLDKERRIIFSQLGSAMASAKNSKLLKERMESIFLDAINRIVKQPRMTNQDDMFYSVHKLRINKANLVFNGQK